MTAKACRIRLILEIILCACGAFAGMRSFGQSWIVTHSDGSNTPTNDYLEVIDLTPSISTNVPNSSIYRNNAFKLTLRAREPVVVMVKASATYGGRIVATYDARALDGTNSGKLSREELRQVWQTNRTLMKASYFRGRLYYPETKESSSQWLTAFISADGNRIAAVHDSGPILVSENTGLTWETLSLPGAYEFTLSTTPAGTALVGVVSLANDFASASGNGILEAKAGNWYCAAVSADGSQLVLTGGPTQSAPVLSITRSESNIVIKWPATFHGYILQQCGDLSAPNWINVTERVQEMDSQNIVSLPFREGRNFFRLTK